MHKKAQPGEFPTGRDRQQQHAQRPHRITNQHRGARVAALECQGKGDDRDQVSGVQHRQHQANFFRGCPQAFRVQGLDVEPQTFAQPPQEERECNQPGCNAEPAPEREHRRKSTISHGRLIFLFIMNGGGKRMSAERILVIEDEHRIAEFIERGLLFEGYRVDVAHDGQTGLAIARDTPPDLAIVDWMLPGIDGIQVCQRLRTATQIPIIMLTAKGEVDDRVTGLDSGADDYLVKPFAFEELLARIRALFRRSTPSSRPEVLAFGDLTLDTGTHRAQRDGRMIDLTAKEYELLELFMRHPRQVLTRDLIFDRVWGYDFGGESNIIEVYVRYLRQKTEAEGEARLLHTVRGFGYVLREDEA